MVPHRHSNMHLLPHGLGIGHGTGPLSVVVAHSKTFLAWACSISTLALPHCVSDHCFRLWNHSNMVSLLCLHIPHMGGVQYLHTSITTLRVRSLFHAHTPFISPSIRPLTDPDQCTTWHLGCQVSISQNLPFFLGSLDCGKTLWIFSHQNMQVLALLWA